MGKRLTIKSYKIYVLLVISLLVTFIVLFYIVNKKEVVNEGHSILNYYENTDGDQSVFKSYLKESSIKYPVVVKQVRGKFLKIEVMESVVAVEGMGQANLSKENVLVKTEGGSNESFPLSSEYIIFCESTEDFTNNDSLYFDEIPEEEKNNIDERIVSKEKDLRYRIVHEYVAGKDIKLGLSTSGKDNTEEVTVIKLYFDDPTLCYE